MELRTLRYYLAAAQEENITRAADILHVTQPTLSRQLMDLEKELGATLMLRGRNGLTLTDDGVFFRQRAEEIVELADRLEQAFLDLNENSDPQQYYDANHLLHTSIIAYGGNSRLEKFYDMLTAQFAIVNRISARDPEHFNASKKKHLNIIRALKQRDEASAERYLFQHLNEVRDRTIKEYSEPFPIKKARSLPARRLESE